MPLEGGVLQFADPSSYLWVTDELILPFYDKRDQLLHPFRSNPDLAYRPYGNAKNIFVNHANNPIYVAIRDADLLSHGHKASGAFTSWREVANESTSLRLTERAEYSKSYALIDVTVYLLHLLNIYEPNKALIANLYYTNTQTDALGRENLTPALVAIAKVIAKSVGTSGRMLSGENQAANLIAFVKRDSELNSVARFARRGVDFERDCMARLEAGGFEVQATRASGDFGADIIAFKDELGYAVQCKDTSKPVGIKAVQEAVGARSHYKTDFAVVCSAGGYTDAAIELASSNKVILCDAEQLVRRLDSV